MACRASVSPTCPGGTCSVDTRTPERLAGPQNALPTPRSVLVVGRVRGDPPTPEPVPILRVAGGFLGDTPTPEPVPILRVAGGFLGDTPTPEPARLLSATGGFLGRTTRPKPVRVDTVVTGFLIDTRTPEPPSGFLGVATPEPSQVRKRFCEGVAPTVCAGCVID